MNATTANSLDIRHFINGHLVDVFNTMLSMKAEPLPDAPLPAFTERTTGCVGFAGDTVTGAVYFHLSSELANQVAANMLGLPAEEAMGETEVNDVVGECSNMLAGGLKSALCDKGYECAVSTPAIIRGTAFAIESMPDVHHERMVFECNGSKLVVEVHIKFIQTT
ncbi:MAG: chemotaxis protein CheX [Limisphaerales bacterium]